MKNRITTMKASFFGALCLLSSCGLTYSCSDDYDLDETLPGFLGGSIYDELKARDFKTVVKLVDDLEYSDVLSRTGSKTLFVAPDSAYARFFATTDWVDASGSPVRSYEQLTLSQKRILLYNVLLNNADVLEMLPYSAGGGSLTMRRNTAASSLDSVKYWQWNELPNNLNEPSEDDATGGDIRFWDAYTNQGRGGIYMALDATAPMMLHFIEDQMKEKDITHDDVSFILGLRGDDAWLNGSAGGKRTYIYDARVIEQDVTCLNGYFNVLDKVVVTPSNMAEVIRTNGSTNLFSQMLDRFSAPYYNASLTEQYKALYDIGNDSVFEKRYISSRSHGGAISERPDRKDLGSFPLLSFDPGWNEYSGSNSLPKEQDMAAMFVPSDAAMEEYFLNGGGRALIERFAKQTPVTRENLSYNLYQIPLNIVQALINNLMKDSFLESVPSKYLTIMNDAQDQMFPATDPNYSSLEQYKESFERCLFANNGVVYVMNRVMTPADYASVIAPVLYSRGTQIVNAVLRADDNFIQENYNSAPLQKYYSTYLKAMQSHFSLFVPTDESLGFYGLVDPMSLARNAASASQYKYWRFTYDNSTNAVFPIKSQAYRFYYDRAPSDGDRALTGAANVSNPGDKGSLNSGAGLVKRQLLTDMVDHHIIVHETGSGDQEDMQGRRRYYLSRSGAPVYLRERGDANAGFAGMVVDGGFQLQMRGDAGKYPDNQPVCTVTESYNLTAELNGYGNGFTFLLDRPMQATTKSVYNILSNDQDHYGEFYKLCETNFSEDDLRLVGLIGEDVTSREEIASEVNKYRIFTNEGVNPTQGESLVRFFNNYRYTIYAPTNDAVLAAFDKGLKSQEDITGFIAENLDEESGTLPEAAQAQARAMITMLVNFVKYHFQDQSFFVDDIDNGGGVDYQTSCIDNEDNVYLSINMRQEPGKITLTDRAGRTVSVQAPYNVLARDANFNAPVQGVATAINSSSYVSIHQIEDVLNFTSLENGRYDSAWSTPSAALKFVTKYRIRK